MFHFVRLTSPVPLAGGWAVIMCPCGIVYIVKCSLRAESPRDFADMLLSWKHMPNVVIYDFARGLATHTNLREPEQLPFRPFEGRLMEPTEENIKLAQNGSVKVSLPWLDTRAPLHDNCGHPVTGSSEHYVLYDRFHEKNTKDKRDFLRRLNLVPQLSGKLNSQVAEKLFAKMKKNNYFMNMALPSTHMFLMGSLVHHHNISQNKKKSDTIRKTFGTDLKMNSFSQAVLGNFQVKYEHCCITKVIDVPHGIVCSGHF